ncbi:MAG TPA: hypothetical protein VFS32_10355 [Candidatus Limnocylindrales bacterium]|nr:hypothetical protein [Candidatus Limnocylindrales bacterium]
MSIDPDVVRKIGLKPGMRVLLLNAPADYAIGLDRLVPDATVSSTDGDGFFEAEAFDLVQLFCANRADLERLGEAAVAAVRPGGRLWVSYPKSGSSVETDLSRDVDWGPLRAAGWRAVTQVAIDPIWSALRFRPAEEVGR